jgi:hypothetical protein
LDRCFGVGLSESRMLLDSDKVHENRQEMTDPICSAQYLTRLTEPMSRSLSYVKVLLLRYSQFAGVYESRRRNF